MKNNQNDMIIAIVAIVLGLIGFSVAFFTKREVSAVPAPEQVNLAPPQIQGADVRMANGLPAPQSNSGEPFTGGSGGGGRMAGGGGGGNPNVPSAAGAGGGGGGGNSNFNPNVPTAAGAGGGGGG